MEGRPSFFVRLEYRIGGDGLVIWGCCKECGVFLGGKWWLECGWVPAHCLGVGSPQGVEQNQTLYAPN